MSELFDKKCVPCEGGVPALDISEIHKYQKKLMDGMSSKMIKIFIFWRKNLHLKTLLRVKNL